MSIDDEVAAVVVGDPALAPLPDAELQSARHDAVTPTPFSCFVTGTDTEVGKTLTSAAMLHALVKAGVRACGMKPVSAGAVRIGADWHNNDADLLATAGNVVMLASLTTPYMLKEAAAPHIAAGLEGVTIELAPILAAYLEVAAASDAVVVEGIGGFRVPLSDGFDTADLAQQLDLPVVLVVGLRLGCLNHALLTVEAIIARGLPLAGWVANELEVDMNFVDANIEALLTRIPAPLLGRVPHLAQPNPGQAAEYLDFSGLPNWPTRQQT